MRLYIRLTFMTWGNSTIDAFREHIGGAKHPIAGGVAVAAVSASFGMSLVALTLEITSRRKNFSGDRTRLKALLGAARKESASLMRCADQDVTAYQKYRDSLRHKRGGDRALRRIIESPMKAAASAVQGLDAAAEAVLFVPQSVRSDLSAAATLVAGAVSAILLNVDVNLRQLPAANQLRRKGVKARRELEKRSSRQLDRVLSR